MTTQAVNALTMQDEMRPSLSAGQKKISSLWQTPVSDPSSWAVTHPFGLRLASTLWDPVPLSAKWIVLLEAHQPYLWAVSTWQFDSHFKAISEPPRARQCADKPIRQCAAHSDSCECSSYGFDSTDTMASLKSNLAGSLTGRPLQEDVPSPGWSLISILATLYTIVAAAWTQNTWENARMEVDGKKQETREGLFRTRAEDASFRGKQGFELSAVIDRGLEGRQQRKEDADLEWVDKHTAWQWLIRDHWLLPSCNLCFTDNKCVRYIVKSMWTVCLLWIQPNKPLFLQRNIHLWTKCVFSYRNRADYGLVLFPSQTDSIKKALTFIYCCPSNSYHLQEGPSSNVALSKQLLHMRVWSDQQFKLQITNY